MDPRLNTRRGKDTKALELGFFSDKTHNFVATSLRAWSIFAKTTDSMG